MKFSEIFSMKLTIVLFFLLPVCLSPNQIMAQSKQQQKTDSVFALLKVYLNAKQTGPLYRLTGAKFQAQMALPELTSFCDVQLFPLGQIKNSSTISFVNNKLATYKIEFQSVTLQLLLTLDAADKIELFVFEPYKIPVPDKAVVSTSNKLITLMDKRVDTAARPYMLKGNTVGLSIGVMRNGIIKSYNYGEIKRGSGILPNPDHIFEIGSITKTFTSILLAWYANAGKLKLTDPITKYLPDSVKTNASLQEITLLMLCNHTSGLPRLPENLETRGSDPLNPYKGYTKEQLFTYLKSWHGNGTPGETYAYSNLAVGLLGTLLEKISGKPFEQMVKEIICDPLNMSSTLQHTDILSAARLVTEYDDDGVQTQLWDFDALSAQGALRSTVHDLMVYAQAYMYPAETPLGKAILLTRQLTFSKDVRVAMGWHIIKVNHTDYYFHNGGTYGSSSFLAWNVAKNLAVVVLSNSGASVDGVGTAILEKLQQGAE
jgi:CubicO group peptidase (beta-lactamase class C family)